jgi:hypothetical protein
VTYLSVGDLDGEPIDDGERGLLAVGVRREELGEQLIVLLAQVRVQRCRSLLRPAPNKEQTINQNHIIIDYKSASYCLHRSMISDINVLYIYRPIGS